MVPRVIALATACAVGVSAIWFAATGRLWSLIRTMRLEAFMIRVVSALRDSARQIRREVASSVFIAVTMAIGIAAAAAIYTVARGVLFRPLPYANAHELVALQEYQPAKSRDQSSVAFANLPRYHQTRTLAAITALSYSELIVSGDADAERVVGAAVDGELLTTLGVRPLAGRGIVPDDGGDNPTHVAVVAYGLWRRRFAGDPALVGRSITVDGAPYTVVGIMPAAFEFPRPAQMDRDVELWIPRGSPPPMMARRGVRDLTVIARLRPGVSQAAAQAEMTVVSRLAASDNGPLNKGWATRVVGLRDVMVGRVRPTIILLAACVGVLLLIASVNASAASLARITLRRQAFGVRLALGASNNRLVELVLAEVAILAIAASVMALPLSAIMRGLLVQLAPVAIPRQQWIAVDGMTVLFTAAIAGATALIAALGPVVWLRRLNVSDLIGDATRTTAGSWSRSRSLGVFVVGQLTMGTFLIAITMGLYSNFASLNRVDPGFVADNVVTATIPLRGMRYRDPRARSALTTQLLARVRAIPGVARAAVATLMPMSGGLMAGPYQVAEVNTDSSATAALRAVSTDFFQTLGIAVEQGRVFGDVDHEGAPLVAVVNEAFVRQTFDTRPALGATVNITPPGADAPQAFQIVGVVGDAKEKDLLGPDSPIIYFSDGQASFPHTVLAFRVTGAPPLTAVRAALRDLDPTLALDDVSPLASKVRASYALQFFLLNILGAFALSAAILIGVGVFGSVSYVIGADLKAIGIRLALGATQWRILSSLLGRTAVWSALGCAVGLGLSVILTRAFSVDGLSINVAAALDGGLIVMVLAIGATWVPAWRASASDAVTTLRLQ